MVLIYDYNDPETLNQIFSWVEVDDLPEALDKFRHVVYGTPLAAFTFSDAERLERVWVSEYVTNGKNPELAAGINETLKDAIAGIGGMEIPCDFKGELPDHDTDWQKYLAGPHPVEEYDQILRIKYTTFI